MTLRDALVARAEEAAKLADRISATDGPADYHVGWNRGFAAGMREASLAIAAHPAVEGDAVPELPTYGIDTANHANVRVRGYTADQMRAYARAALDAAWPGMVADAKWVRAWRNRFVSERTAKHQRDGNDYEYARTLAECDANEFEKAFMEASRG